VFIGASNRLCRILMHLYVNLVGLVWFLFKYKIISRDFLCILDYSRKYIRFINERSPFPTRNCSNQ